MFTYGYGSDFPFKTYIAAYPEVATDALKRAMITCITMLSTDESVSGEQADEALRTVLGFTRDLMYAKYIDDDNLSSIVGTLNRKENEDEC